MEDYFAHPTAVIDDGAEIGAGTKIWHFSHIMAPSTIGEGCNIGQNVVVAPRCRIGRNCKLQNNVSVYSGVVLEDDVFCGPSMVFTNVINPRSHVNRRGEYKETVVRQGASIGANATILCGLTLGRFCLVGAGAVVTKPVPEYAIIVGNPGRLAGYACWCGLRLELAVSGPDSEATCQDCGRRYAKQNGDIQEVRS